MKNNCYICQNLLLTIKIVCSKSYEKSFSESVAFVAGIAGTFAWLGTDYRPQDTNYERRDGVGPGALHIGHE